MAYRRRRLFAAPKQTTGRTGRRKGGWAKIIDATQQPSASTAQNPLGKMLSVGMKAKKELNKIGVTDAMMWNVLKGFANATQGQSTIPGVGVLSGKIVNTSIRRTTNVGTGTTITRHISGKPKFDPSWQKEGQKYIYNLTTPEFCASLSSAAPLTSVVSLPQMRRLELAAMHGLMFSGSGSDADPTQSTYLSQRGDSLNGSMYISEASSELVITSATNMNAKFRIYECVARYDSSLSNTWTPGGAWQNGVTALGGVNTSDTWRNKLVFPSYSQAFRTTWAVEGIYDVNLAAGGTHRHISKYNVGCELPNARYVLYNDSHIIAGITRYIMIVLEPSVAHDATTETNVGYADTTIDYIYTRTMEYYGKPNARTILNSENNTDTVTTPEFMGDTSLSEDTPEN